ncbi:MAG: Fe-S cluster assembly ATPase SufC [Infirmifilum sp.]
MEGIIVENLHVRVEGKEVLKGVNLRAPRGKVTVVIGPNGGGKSTLLLSIMGYPRYEITKGRIFLDGEDVTTLKPHERARKGLFLAFQSPPELPGVPVANFLYEAAGKLGLSVGTEHLSSSLKLVGLSDSYLERFVHVGFSGGEKKRFEVAQALALNPTFIMLDEPDSGLDIEGLKLLATIVEGFAKSGKSVLLVSHNTRTIDFINPHSVLVLVAGKIVAQGGLDLVRKIEAEGFPVVD